MTREGKRDLFGLIREDEVSIKIPSTSQSDGDGCFRCSVFDRGQNISHAPKALFLKGFFFSD